MVELRAQAFVHWDRWVARCPMPACPNAEHHGADPTTGHVGGLTGSSFRCAHCGWHGPVDWPPNVDDIMRILRMRPVPSTRNWLPHETVYDLFAENLAYGVLPVTRSQVEAGETFKALEIAGDRIVTGPALEPAGCAAIGGS